VHTTPVSLLARLRQPAAEQAWQRFVELYTPVLYACARSLGLCDADAADLVQDVFLVLVQKLPEFQYDPHKSFQAWLRTLMLNKWRDNVKRAQGLRRIPDAALENLTVPDAAETLWEAEYRRHLVGRAMDILQAEFQPTTWKAFWEFVALGQPAHKVAADLGISENAVYIAKCRVLRRLRQELAGLTD
jgi:RNA polymerase sigma-70 factor (ECF subfamily)